MLQVQSDKKMMELRKQQQQSSSDTDATIILLQSKVAYYIGTLYHDVDVDWIKNNISENDGRKEENDNDDDEKDEAIDYFAQLIRMEALHANAQSNNTLLSKNEMTLAQLQMSDMLHRSAQLSNDKKDNNQSSSAFLSYIIKSI